MAGSFRSFFRCHQFFKQFFPRTEACHFNINILSQYKAGQTDHLLRQVHNFYRFPHVQHKDFAAVTQAPGCEEAGVKTFVCTVCGETREEAVPALSHAWTLAETLSELETTEDRHGTARFRCSRCGAEKTGSRCAAQIFTDMPRKSNWAHDPIDWAYFNGVTAGKTASEFAPKATVTRAEVVSFLWSCAGKPEPKSSRSPFRDVKESSYYFKPVLWAVENGITAGKTPRTPAPGPRW